MELKSVGVVGCGLMGHGITWVSALAGYDVVVREVDDAKLAKGIAKIEKGLARAIEKGKLEQSAMEAALARIKPTTSYNDLAQCDLILEAITEDRDAKLAMWKEIDTIAKPDAFFATNTSSLPVIDQAMATSRPDKFFGLHFFNPVPMMRLVEVVRCLTTSDEAFDLGLTFGKKLGKETVEARDTPGFIVNRLLIPYLLDAIRAYEEGVGSVEQIDAAMKAGAAHPLGPLALSDLVGLDTLGFAGDAMFEEFRDRRFARPPLLRKLLAAGWLGRKSQRGFYDYSGEVPVPNRAI